MCDGWKKNDLVFLNQENRTLFDILKQKRHVCHFLEYDVQNKAFILAF